MNKSSLATISVPAYSGNYTQGRRGNKISKITVHHMAGVMSATQCGALWQRQGRRGSSHYGIGNDGAIGNYVDENNIAWTDSNWKSNCTSVTIETSNNAYGGDWTVSDAALNSLIKLCADIAKRNGLGTLVPGKTLTWHSMYANTTCPGNYLRSKMQYIADEANKINNCSVVVPIPAKNTFLPSRGYFKYGDKGDNVAKINDFYYRVFPGYEKVLKRNKENVKGNLFGENTKAWTKEFQRRKGLTPDGCIGPITLKALVAEGFRY